MSVTDDNQATCPNCGAAFDAREPRCPYCGALNPIGAEQAYMETLNDLEDETDRLDDEAKRTVEGNIKSNAKRIVITVIAIVAVLAAAFAILHITDKADEQRALEDYQARETFREEHFAELDRLYAEGDDAALSAYSWSLVDEPGYDALFSWQHYEYLDVIADYEMLSMMAEDIREGTGDLDDYTFAVKLAIGLAQLDGNELSPATSLTQEEEARVAGYRAFAQTFLQDTLQMNEEEVAAFADSVKDEYGDVQNDELERSLKQRLDQLGTTYRGGVL